MRSLSGKLAAALHGALELPQIPRLGFDEDVKAVLDVLPFASSPFDLHAEYSVAATGTLSCEAMPTMVVPEGEVWILQNISACNADMDSDFYIDALGIRKASGRYYWLVYLLGSTNKIVAWTGSIIMDKGDTIMFHVNAFTGAGDCNLRGMVRRWKVK
jgi:hypothetical protein